MGNFNGCVCYSLCLLHYFGTAHEANHVFMNPQSDEILLERLNRKPLKH